MTYDFDSPGDRARERLPRLAAADLQALRTDQYRERARAAVGAARRALVAWERGELAECAALCAGAAERCEWAWVPLLRPEGGFKPTYRVLFLGQHLRDTGRLLADLGTAARVANGETVTSDPEWYRERAELFRRFARQALGHAEERLRAWEEAG